MFGAFCPWGNGKVCITKTIYYYITLFAIYYMQFTHGKCINSDASWGTPFKSVSRCESVREDRFVIIILNGVA